MGMQFTNWRDVLASVQSDELNSDISYLIRVDDTRTRFMNRIECINFIESKIDPKKTLAQFIKDRLV